MRKLGLDVGDKTIGVALSDPLGISAQGVETIERVGIQKDTKKVVAHIKDNEVDTVVIGLPLGMDGNDTEQTQKVRDFREVLEKKITGGGIKGVSIVWQDERLTTVQAEKVLIEGGLSREKRKKVIDKQAAVIILQTYLDAH